MDSRLVKIFCANLPSQKARGASYNLLLLLRKDCLFCHRSECYGPPSPSISLESIKSQEEKRRITRILANEWIRADSSFSFPHPTDYDKRSAANVMALG